MKLVQWLRMVPTAGPEVGTPLDEAVIKAANDDLIQEITELDNFGVGMYIAGRVHLLHILVEYGIPDDLQEIYHGENNSS